MTGHRNQSKASWWNWKASWWCNFFSGKLLNCTGCHFRNNRVTGNGGALFVESVQPGRVVIDPDIDFYADDSNYANRIDLQAAGIPEVATFRCNNCIFEDNLAMSVSRGPLNTFESLTGGFGGAVFVGTGIRYKVLLEQTRTDRIASVRRAFGSHGSVDIFFNESQFNGNYAWKSGGAINVLGGRSVAKNSVIKFQVDGSTFDKNYVSQGEGGAVKLDKGQDNGDYRCVVDGCDTMHFKASVKDTAFINNYAGKAKEPSDIDGNTETEDDPDAWRHVSNFNRDCDHQCCSLEDDSVCQLQPGVRTKCKDNGNKQYTCNDGLYLEGTSTANLCTISAVNNQMPCWLPPRAHAGTMHPM